MSLNQKTGSLFHVLLHSLVLILAVLHFLSCKKLNSEVIRFGPFKGQGAMVPKWQTEPPGGIPTIYPPVNQHGKGKSTFYYGGCSM